MTAILMHEITCDDLRDAADVPAPLMLVMVGLDFRTAPIALREQVAIGPDDASPALCHIAQHPQIDETLLLSTCNRTELYAVVRNPHAWRALLCRLLAACSGADAGAIDAAVYAYAGEDAARHLFRVAAGLESMVVGEAEIVCQLKRASKVARACETTGTILHRLYEKALAASKRARTQVRYDEFGLSVASVAVAACKRTFPDLRDVTVLVLGAGETAELTLHYLVNKGARKVRIANRTLARAEQLARLTNGQALTLAEFPRQLGDADVVICCTASPQPLVTVPMLQSVMAAHPEKRLLVIDLAIPRDVEPEVASMRGIRLLNVDNLHGTAQELAQQRQDKIQEAERIVDEEACDFGTWLASRHTVAVVMALRERIERLRLEAVARISREARHAPAEIGRIADEETEALVDQLLREALGAMQRVTGHADHSAQMTMARKILEHSRSSSGCEATRERTHEAPFIRT